MNKNLEKLNNKQKHENFGSSCKIELTPENIETMHSCKDCQYLKDLLRWAFGRVNSQRNKHKSLEYTIDKYTFINRPMWRFCSYTGLPLTFRSHADFTGASLDRIDNSLGYTPENCILICKGLNYMKNEYTNKDLYDYILKMQKGVPTEVIFTYYLKKKINNKLSKIPLSERGDFIRDDLYNLVKKSQGICALTGVNIDLKNEKENMFSLQFDRIDPKGIYSKNNIQIVSKAGNYLKGNYMSTEDTKKAVDLIISVIPKLNIIKT